MSYFQKTLKLLVPIIVFINTGCSEYQDADGSLKSVWVSEALPNQNLDTWTTDHGAQCLGFHKSHFPVDSLHDEDFLWEQTDQWKSVSGLSWKRHFFSGNAIGFFDMYPNAHNKVIYVAERIQVDTSDTRLLALGSDDGIKVYLNGQEIYKNHLGRGLRAEDDFVTLDLLPGYNTLLYKVDQGDGGWALWRKIYTKAETDSIVQTLTPWLYSTLFDSHILPDSANEIAIRQDNRRGHDQFHRIKLHWMTLNGDTFATAQLNPVQLSGGTIDLPLEFRGSALVNYQTINHDNRIVYQETVPIFRERATQPLVANYLNRLAQTPHQRIRQRGVEFAFRKDRLGDFSTLIRAQLLYDLYLSFHVSTDSLFNIPGVHTFAYLSPTDGSLQPYRLFIPADLQSSEPAKVTYLIFGSGEEEKSYWENHEARSHRHNRTRVVYSSLFNRLIVIPFGRGSENHLGQAIEEIPILQDELEYRFPRVEPDITFYSWSTGGENLVNLLSILELPIEAIGMSAPILSEDESVHFTMLNNLKYKHPGTKFFLRYGMQDQILPAHRMQRTVSVLKDLGFSVEYSEIPNSNHHFQVDSAEEAFYRWLKSERKN